MQSVDCLSLRKMSLALRQIHDREIQKNKNKMLRNPHIRQKPQGQIIRTALSSNHKHGLTAFGNYKHTQLRTKKRMVKTTHPSPP
jgi:hypothetical protein